MTPTQARYIIIKACQDANPKLLELTFGCEFMKNAVLHKIVRFNPYSPDGWRLISTVVNGKREEDWLVFPENIKSHIKILGHQPTLADVLLAIAAHPSRYTIWIDNSGSFDFPAMVIQKGKSEKDEDITSWNLSLPFSEQSSETVLFIAELLK